MAATQTKHYKVIALKTIYVPIPKFSLPPGHTYDMVEYSNTSDEEVLPRIRDADIVITPSAPLTAEILAPDATPKLKLLQAVGAGTVSTTGVQAPNLRNRFNQSERPVYR